MSMTEVHSQALDGIVAVYHEFLGRFSKTSRKVFGFVEGREDISFYQGFIDQVILENWQVELWPAGNKDKVMELYLSFDWNRFSKKQIVFFVDRDLSNLMGEKISNEENIFTTEGYSIENYVVNRSTCDRLLCEIFSLSVLPKFEKDKILDLFDDQLETFTESLLPVMAWILQWKRSGQKPCLNDILMKHIFNLNQGKVEIYTKPKDCSCIAEYIHKQCNIAYDESFDTSMIKKEMLDYGNIFSLVRGKYLLWFLVEFALSVHKDIGKLSASIESPPKIHVALSQSNWNVLIAPRSRIPESLKSFLQSTFSVHIRFFEGFGDSPRCQTYTFDKTGFSQKPS